MTGPAAPPDPYGQTPYGQQPYGQTPYGGALAAPAPPPGATGVAVAPPPAAWQDPTVAVRRATEQGAAVAQGAVATLAAGQVTSTTTARAAALGDPPPGPSTLGGRPPDTDDGKDPSGRLRRLRIGSHLASRAALQRLGLTGPGTGLVVGVDTQAAPVTVRLFRPEPTRVTVVGGIWAVQLLVFRAFAVGARVVVVSEHPQEWLSFAQHATGRADRLLPLGPAGIAPAEPRQPTLIIDDRGQAASAFAAPLLPWQTQITLLASLDSTGLPLVQEADLTVLQRLGAGEAPIAAHALGLPRQSQIALQAMPDDVLALVTGGTESYVNVSQTEIEHRFVGAPRPRPVAPLPAPAPPPAPVPVPVLVPVPVPVPTLPSAPAAPPISAPPLPVSTPPVVSTPPQYAPPPVYATPPVGVPMQRPAAPLPVAPPPLAPPPGVYIGRPGAVIGAGPAIGAPDPRTRTGLAAPDLFPDDDTDEPGTRRRGNRPVVVGVVTIVALLVAGWVSASLLTGTPRSQPSAPHTAAATPQQVVPHTPPLPTITAEIVAGGIRFTWHYTDPQPEDIVRVRRTDINDGEWVVPADEFYLVEAAHACLDVQVLRNNQFGNAANLCYPDETGEPDPDQTTTEELAP